MDFSQYLLHELYGTHEDRFICSCGLKLNKFNSDLPEEELEGLIKFLASKYCIETYFDGHIKDIILADPSIGMSIVAICFKGYGADPPELIKDGLTKIVQKISDLISQKISRVY